MDVDDALFLAGKLSGTKTLNEAVHSEDVRATAVYLERLSNVSCMS